MIDVLIIGAGPAGLTAAIYAARAGVSVMVLEKGIYGGQVSFVSHVDNFPTRPMMEGTEFASALYEHAISEGADIRFEEVQALELRDDVKKITTTNTVYEAHSVILAGGASPRKLGCPGEMEFTGRGVSYCATCDGAFYKDKVVAVAGGGDTALDDALFLANQCKQVYLVHRRDEFRAQQAKQNALRGRQNIKPVLSAIITAIEGDTKVHSCVLSTPNGPQTLLVDGVFIAVGQNPQTSLYKGQLPLDTTGYAIAGEDCRTPLPGVFVAGDLRQKPLRQIITAAADGAVAAVGAAEYCNTKS